jgi:hypothetical protein
VLDRERDQALALGSTGRHARRVLEVRDHVDDAGHATRPTQAIERVDVDAVRRERQGFDRRAEALEEEDRPVVRRRLDDREAALPREEVLDHQRRALQRPVREQHALDRDVVAPREPLAQRAIAFGVAVGERAAGVARKRPLGRGGELTRRQQVRRRHPARERDRFHAFVLARPTSFGNTTSGTSPATLPPRPATSFTRRELT